MPTFATKSSHENVWQGNVGLEGTRIEGRGRHLLTCSRYDSDFECMKTISGSWTIKTRFQTPAIVEWDNNEWGHMMTEPYLLHQMKRKYNHSPWLGIRISTFRRCAIWLHWTEIIIRKTGKLRKTIHQCHLLGVKAQNFVCHPRDLVSTLGVSYDLGSL